MELRSWLLFIHIVAAFTWVGGSILFQTLGIRAARIADPARSSDGARTLAFAGPRVVMPAAAVTLAAGIGLVLESEVWEFTMGWIAIAVVVVLATATLVFGYYLPRARKVIAMFDGHGPSAELVAVWRPVVTISMLNTLALIAVMWLMVFKPG